jgi:anti-anti-sigma factor
MGFLEVLELYNSLHRGAPVAIKKRDPCLLELSLSGELDMKAASDLTPLFDAVVLECPPKSRLVLDLSLVNYISSTGVGLLSSILVKSGRRSVSLVLLNIPQKIRNIMDTLGLMSYFTEEKSGCA